MALSSGTKVSMVKIATASAQATKGTRGAARKAAGDDLSSISLVLPSLAVQERPSHRLPGWRGKPAAAATLGSPPPAEIVRSGLRAYAPNRGPKNGPRGMLWRRGSQASGFANHANTIADRKGGASAVRIQGPGH